MIIKFHCVLSDPLLICCLLLGLGGVNLAEGGGTIRKSIIKNSTPWNRAGAGAGSGGDQSSANLNRAARRALSKGGSH